MKYRIARLPINRTLLKEFLKLPEHLEIVGIRESKQDVEDQRITFLVMSPYCQEVEFMDDIPELDLQYRQKQSGELTLVAIKGLDT